MFNRLEKTKQASRRYRRDHVDSGGLGATDRTGLSDGSSDSIDHGQEEDDEKQDQSAADGNSFVGEEDIECVLSASSRVMAIDHSQESSNDAIPKKSSKSIASGGINCDIELPLLVQSLQNKLEVMAEKIEAMEKETKREQREIKDEMNSLLAERGKPKNSPLSKNQNASSDTELVLLPEDLYTLTMDTNSFENGRPTQSVLFFCSLIFAQWSLSVLIMMDSGIYNRRLNWFRQTVSGDCPQGSLHTFKSRSGL